jgi:hypothetical protein
LHHEVFELPIGGAFNRLGALGLLKCLHPIEIAGEQSQAEQSIPTNCLPATLHILDDDE